jgi:hypothetical protein
MFGNEKLYDSHDICYKYGASKLVHQKFPLSITCRKHPVYPLERERDTHTHTHKAKQQPLLGYESISQKNIKTTKALF